MKILSIIPTRGRLKFKKNIKKLLGKPLVEWSIETSKRLKNICDTLVSTDLPEIINLSKKHNVLAPWLRPKHLSGDDVNTVDVVLHASSWYEKNVCKIDGILLLQPTSPFRNVKIIENGINIFLKNQKYPIVSVSPSKSNPMKCIKIKNNKLRNIYNSQLNNFSEQNLEKFFEINGSVYLVSKKLLKENKSFYTNEMIPLVMNNFEESIDIDTENDWKIAEHICYTKSDE